MRNANLRKGVDTKKNPVYPHSCNKKCKIKWTDASPNFYANIFKAIPLKVPCRAPNPRPNPPIEIKKGGGGGFFVCLFIKSLAATPPD